MRERRRGKRDAASEKRDARSEGEREYRDENPPLISQRVKAEFLHPSFQVYPQLNNRQKINR